MAAKTKLRAKGIELEDALSEQEKLQKKVIFLGERLTEQVKYINVGTCADIYPHCIHVCTCLQFINVCIMYEYT